MSESKANAFSMEQLTMKEAGFLLFGKKVCPKCGCKLNKSKEHIYLKGDDPRVNPRGEWKETKKGKVFVVKSTNPTIHPSHTVKYVYWLFSCPRCNGQYRIKELLDSKQENTFEK